MKDSDLQNASRILKLIRQLTAEEVSRVEIVNDNPDPEMNDLPDCLIQCRRWDGRELIEHFRADTLLDCLLQAIAERGLTEEAVAEMSAPEEMAKAALKALEVFTRCRESSNGRFSGGVTVGCTIDNQEFELTIHPKRTGFAFVENADTIERDRSDETPVEETDESGNCKDCGSKLIFSSRSAGTGLCHFCGHKRYARIAELCKSGPDR